LLVQIRVRYEGIGHEVPGVLVNSGMLGGVKEPTHTWPRTGRMFAGRGVISGAGMVASSRLETRAHMGPVL
jgi:hypothetical protein